MLDVAFGLLVVVAVAGAVMAVSLRKVFHNLLGFSLSLLGLAGVSLILGSEFIALMQVLVFLGGITIAMVFAVMMSTPREQGEEPRRAGRVAGALLVGFGFAGAVAWALLGATWTLRTTPHPPDAWSVERLGELLLTTWELPFEAISLLLLAAILGAILIARRSREDHVIDPPAAASGAPAGEVAGD